MTEALEMHVAAVCDTACTRARISRSHSSKVLDQTTQDLAHTHVRTHKKPATPTRSPQVLNMAAKDFNKQYPEYPAWYKAWEVKNGGMKD